VGKKQQAQQGEKPHPVCFADIPLLHKGEGIATSPYCPSPSQGEGRFGESQNRVRSGQVGEKQQSQQGEKPHPVCFADIPLLRKERELRPHPAVPLLHKERDVLAVAKTG